MNDRQIQLLKNLCEAVYNHPRGYSLSKLSPKARGEKLALEMIFLHGIEEAWETCRNNRDAFQIALDYQQEAFEIVRQIRNSL